MSETEDFKAEESGDETPREGVDSPTNPDQVADPLSSPEMVESNHHEPIQTERPVSQYVRIESLILSTPSADAYRAFDSNEKQSCSLWLSRAQLASGSDEILTFLRKLEAIDRIEPPICSLSGYGVDAEGTAFALFPALDGYPVAAGNLEGAEAERRFSNCLRLVSLLHERGVALGDISSDSFWLTRDGELLVVGLIGILTRDPRDAVSHCPASSLPFLAPEIRRDAIFDRRSDVYSLGVLGYFLFTRTYPYGAGESGVHDAPLQPIGELLPNPPVWADEILSRALDRDPAARFESATEMLAELKKVRARVSEDDAMPIIRRRSSHAVQPTRHAVPQPRDEGDRSPTSRQSRAIGVPTSQVILLLLLFVILIASLLFLFPSVSPEAPAENATRLEDRLRPVLEAVKDEPIAQELEGLADSRLPLSERKKFLRKLVLSDDPFAHDALLKSAQEAPNGDFRQASEKALLDRARRQGLSRAAEQARLWLRTLRSNEYPVGYEPLLQVLDRSLPLDARFSALRKAYSSQPTVALRLGAALTFDLEQLEEFRPVLSQMVGDSLRLEDAAARSAIALIMVHPDLSVVFAEDVLQFREQVPNGDITWLMKRLAVRRDVHVRAIANLALERELVSPIRSVFLETIRDRADLPAHIVTALVRGASGALEPEDLAAFGRWYDFRSEKVLLAALADVRDVELSRRGIETLAGKSLVQEPSASVMEWIRESEWEQREKFSQLVGMLGHLDRVTPEALAEELKLLDSLVRDSELLNILLDTDNGVIVSTVVTKYGDVLGLGTLLTLLDSRDPTIRIEAIRALKGFNDLGALKIIIDHYEREKDARVKEVYRETFWVIKKRESEGEPLGGL
ncbi:hypothetical protein MRY87_06960 [bacterium]|nr:hypothetical protein [bacterium]